MRTRVDLGYISQPTLYSFFKSRRALIAQGQLRYFAFWHVRSRMESQNLPGQIIVRLSPKTVFRTYCAGLPCLLNELSALFLIKSPSRRVRSVRQLRLMHASKC